MANWVQQTLMQLKVFVKRKAKEIETMEKWQQVKDKFVDMFQENKRLESEIKGLYQEIDNYNKADKEFTEVIESKKELIRDIEEYEENQNKLLKQLKELEPKAYQGYTREEYINEVKGLSFEERIEKAEDMIEERRILERSRDYGIEL